MRSRARSRLAQLAKVGVMGAHDPDPPGDIMKRFLLMVALIATLSVAFVIPAHADDPWQCTFDFTIAENGFAADVSPWGTWASGTGYTPGDGTFTTIGPDIGIRSIIVNKTIS